MSSDLDRPQLGDRCGVAVAVVVVVVVHSNEPVSGNASVIAIGNLQNVQSDQRDQHDQHNRLIFGVPE